MSKERIGIKKFDYFGRPINFFFQGDNLYRTYFGTGISFIAYLGILFMLTIKFIEFIAETDPIEHFSEAR